ncbi:hypothetical protein IDH44_18805 [Paenibacillus sp. IB182496]|uniref:Uncharacterized protein n=1 Tax=Paenibacillus sabuli TaxID=2772509 RepID=A0A927BXI2_9BACL|nr:hypothetical protein [Paenibacillus sabuli]MBD2847254.1 hypothetical protein [Paenibacillus sabuli]
MSEASESNITSLLVEARLALTAGVKVDYAESLELALDCPRCEESDRTVRFTAERGRCRSAGHTYAGRLTGKLVEEAPLGEKTHTSATGEVRLEREERVQYSLEIAEALPALPTWGRIRFTLSCPACGTSLDSASQNNVKRPREILCDCGRLLALETREQPTIREQSA